MRGDTTTIALLSATDIRYSGMPVYWGQVPQEATSIVALLPGYKSRGEFLLSFYGLGRRPPKPLTNCGHRAGVHSRGSQPSYRPNSWEGGLGTRLPQLLTNCGHRAGVHSRGSQPSYRPNSWEGGLGTRLPQLLTNCGHRAGVHSRGSQPNYCPSSSEGGLGTRLSPVT